MSGHQYLWDKVPITTFILKRGDGKRHRTSIMYLALFLFLFFFERFTYQRERARGDEVEGEGEKDSEEDSTLCVA